MRKKTNLAEKTNEKNDQYFWPMKEAGKCATCYKIATVSEE